MNWRYGIKEYLEGGVSGSVFEIIEVHVDADGDRWWTNPFVIGDDIAGLVRVTEMVTADVRELKQPDVITTLTEWWWADAPEVKYPVEDEEVLVNSDGQEIGRGI
jgi:hypothetical protein